MVKFIAHAVIWAMILTVSWAGGHQYIRIQSDAIFNADAPLRDASDHMETGEEGTDSHESGTVLIVMEALDESFVPVFQHPSDAGLISPISVRIPRSTLISKIYHPPIV